MFSQWQSFMDKLLLCVEFEWPQSMWQAFVENENGLPPAKQYNRSTNALFVYQSWKCRWRNLQEETPKHRPMSSLTAPRRDKSQMCINIFLSVYHVHRINGESLIWIKQDALRSYSAFFRKAVYSFWKM